MRRLVLSSCIIAFALLLLEGTSQAQLRTAGVKRKIIRRASLVQDKQPAAPAPAPAPEPTTTIVEEGVVPDELYVEPIAPGTGANCGACNRWTRIDYLLWWRRGRDTPPLVSNGPLQAPGTQTFFGGEDFAEDVTPGGRIDFGIWVDNCMCTGIGARFFSLGTSSLRYNVGPSDDTTIVRPFFNTISGSQDARLVNQPNVFSGTASVLGESEVLGGDVYYRKVLAREQGFQLDFLAGYQFARIDEDITIRDSSTNVSGGNVNGIADGTNIQSLDLFRTNNEFNGGNFGFETRIERGCWSATFLGKIGFGEVRQQLTTAGQFIVTDPTGGVASVNSGVLVQPSNTGVFQQNKFAVAPEFGVNASWRMSPRVEFSIGYSFLFWSSILRTGDHIDLNVNPTQSAPVAIGDPSPVITLNDSSFWVHGINFGGRIDW